MIDFATEEEAQLYQRIEDYITRYYEAYSQDKKTKPLGVHHDRLPASPHLFALRRVSKP